MCNSMKVKHIKLELVDAGYKKETMVNKNKQQLIDTSAPRFSKLT